MILPLRHCILFFYLTLMAVGPSLPFLLGDRINKKIHKKLVKGNHNNNEPNQKEELFQGIQQPPSSDKSQQITSRTTPTKKEDSPVVQMTRAGFRLDGLEVHAVVSALTLATSIQLFELLSQQWHWGATVVLGTSISRWEVLLSTSADLVCLIASALGMISGLHATLVFSLMTVYS